MIVAAATWTNRTIRARPLSRPLSLALALVPLSSASTVAYRSSACTVIPIVHMSSRTLVTARASSRSCAAKETEKETETETDTETETTPVPATTVVAASSVFDAAECACEESSTKRFWTTVGGVSGLLAVATGSFGAHGLKARVTDTYYLDIWHTASQYHLVHALAIVAAAGVVGGMQRHRARTGLGVWSSTLANLTGSMPPPRSASSVALIRRRRRSYRNWSAGCFLFGTVFFSGSLYALTLTENKKWGAVTPIGGVGLILGWIFLAVGV